MKIHARDIIAIILLVGGFWMISQGFDGIIYAIMTAIVGYYFSKRVFEEKNGKK